MNKNAYKLTGKRKKNGYDWWWHSFTAKNEKTGDLKPFFIEYYVINPHLWDCKIILGQKKDNKKQNKKPVYAMIKAGSWGKEKAQINNFYNIPDFFASNKNLECKIGDNLLSETYLKGSVFVSKNESKNNPELMSDAGSMKWNLKINKKLNFDVGYGTSALFNSLHIFEMYWHVQGMLCELSGKVEFNGQKYIVEPKKSYGYQDKNWGKDYTNPWIWLNCNNFFSKKKNKKVPASLVVGGGCPKIAGIALKRKILTAFFYDNQFYEFNFSKFWKYSKQSFKTYEDDNFFYWNIVSKNRKIILDIKFKCRKDYLLKINYENPQGKKNHNNLLNGGNAEGFVKIYKNTKNKELIDELEGNFGGCEYGEY